MKLKAITAAAFLLAVPALHAFTLDFSAYVPSTIPPNLTVAVPGYGNVLISAGFNASTVSESILEVGTSFLGLPTLEFDNNDQIRVTFLDGTPTGPVTFSGITSSGESFSSQRLGLNEWVVTLQNSSDGAGLATIDFTAAVVPEPTSAMLGLIGAAGLVLRRRR